MTTRSNDMVGVYDPDSGQPFCLRCWGGKDVMSTRPILLKDRGSRKTCKGCKRRISETSPGGETVSLQIMLQGDGCWPDLKELDAQGKLTHVKGTMQVARLSGGMGSGKDSVAFRIDLPDGSVVVSETSMKLFLHAADVFRTADQLGKADQS